MRRRDLLVLGAIRSEVNVITAPRLPASVRHAGRVMSSYDADEGDET